MPRTSLSPTQRRLLRELDEIVALLRLNYREIEEYEPAAQTAAFRDLGERIASELSGLALSSNTRYGCI